MKGVISLEKYASPVSSAVGSVIIFMIKFKIGYSFSV